MHAKLAVRARLGCPLQDYFYCIMLVFCRNYEYCELVYVFTVISVITSADHPEIMANPGAREFPALAMKATVYLKLCELRTHLGN